MAKVLPSGHTNEEIEKMFSNKRSTIPNILTKYRSYYYNICKEGAIQILKYIDISGMDKIDEIREIKNSYLGNIIIYTNIRLKNIGYLYLNLVVDDTNKIQVNIRIESYEKCSKYYSLMKNHLGDKWESALSASHNKPLYISCVLTKQDLLEQNIDEILLDIILRTKDAVDEINGIEE